MILNRWLDTNNARAIAEQEILQLVITCCLLLFQQPVVSWQAWVLKNCGLALLVILHAAEHWHNSKGELRHSLSTFDYVSVHAQIKREPAHASLSDKRQPHKRRRLTTYIYNTVIIYVLDPSMRHMIICLTQAWSWDYRQNIWVYQCIHDWSQSYAYKEHDVINK